MHELANSSFSTIARTLHLYKCSRLSPVRIVNNWTLLLCIMDSCTVNNAQWKLPVLIRQLDIPHRFLVWKICSSLFKRFFRALDVPLRKQQKFRVWEELLRIVDLLWYLLMLSLWVWLSRSDINWVGCIIKVRLFPFVVVNVSYLQYKNCNKLNDDVDVDARNVSMTQVAGMTANIIVRWSRISLRTMTLSLCSTTTIFFKRQIYKWVFQCPFPPTLCIQTINFSRKSLNQNENLSNLIFR